LISPAEFCGAFLPATTTTQKTFFQGKNSLILGSIDSPLNGCLIYGHLQFALVKFISAKMLAMTTEANLSLAPWAVRQQKCLIFLLSRCPRNQGMYCNCCSPCYFGNITSPINDTEELKLWQQWLKFSLKFEKTPKKFYLIYQSVNDLPVFFSSRIVPYLIPLSHMAVMVSNFCTGIMGFER